jgi:hypothetical protein
MFLLIMFSLIILSIVLKENNNRLNHKELFQPFLMVGLAILLVTLISLLTFDGDRLTQRGYLKYETVTQTFKLKDSTSLKISEIDNTVYFLYTDGEEVKAKTLKSETEVEYYDPQVLGRTDAFVVEQKYAQPAYVLLYQLWANQAKKTILFLPNTIKP